MTDILDAAARPLGQGGAALERTAVALVVDPAHVRRFELVLASRLQAAGAHVSLRLGRRASPMPSSLSLLLQFERLVYRLKGPLLAEAVGLARLGLPHSSGDGCEVVVDLCGDAGVAGQSRHLRVLYDGLADDMAMLSAVVAGRMPVIVVEDAGTGTAIAGGTAAADNAGTVSEAVECVLARTLTLIVAAVRGRGSTPAPVRPLAAPSGSMRALLAFELKALAAAAVSRLYHLCCHAPHWRVQWRSISGAGLWETQSLRGTSWSVIGDPGHRFYADPFPFVHEGQSFVFVEDLDHRTNKGVISVIPFDRNGPSGAARPVLEEPWHLSYPFMIRHDGDIWMVPESSANATLTLYRADPFPYRWVPEATLLRGIAASDATIIRHDDLFWMFAATRDGYGSWSDTLSIWWAHDLRGPWNAHARNPVLVDQATARPAGAMVKRNGRLWRPVQDCTDGYGTGIGLAEVTALDPERFEQRVATVLRAEAHWPGRRLHTLNSAGALECIDGAAYSPKSRILARWFEQRSGRRNEPQH